MGQKRRVRNQGGKKGGSATSALGIGKSGGRIKGGSAENWEPVNVNVGHDWLPNQEPSALDG